MRLSDLVRSAGYGFVVESSPTWEGHTVLGDPPSPRSFTAVLCEDAAGRRYIACRADCLDHLYSCAHEIAEDQCGHEHTARTFARQSQILAGWGRMLGSAAA